MAVADKDKLATLESLKAVKDAAVQKSGDTMTGLLTLKTNLNVSNPTTTSARLLSATDSNDTLIGYFRSDTLSSGQVSLQMAATKEINGSNVVNNIKLNVNSDGSTTYAVANPTAFRSAISAPAMGDYTGNIDDIRDTSLYYLRGATATGFSSGMYGMLITACDLQTHARAVQLFIELWADAIHMRRFTGTDWQAWKNVTLT